jgi:hypothetical protein
MQSKSEIAQAEAALIVEEGLSFAEAKFKAAQGNRRMPHPNNEEVEAAIWEYNAIFKSQTQNEELRKLRELALSWMERLEPFRPLIRGGVWYGWAGKMNAIELELYCDEQKLLEFFLINMGVEFDVFPVKSANFRPQRSSQIHELVWWDSIASWTHRVPIHAIAYENEGFKGSLLEDKQGRTPRGTKQALVAKMLLSKKGESDDRIQK